MMKLNGIPLRQEICLSVKEGTRGVQRFGMVIPCFIKMHFTVFVSMKW